VIFPIDIAISASNEKLTVKYKYRKNIKESDVLRRKRKKDITSVLKMSSVFKKGFVLN